MSLPYRNAQLSIGAPKLIVGEVGKQRSPNMIRLVWKFSAPMDIGGHLYNGAMIECTREEALTYWRALGDKLGKIVE